MSNLIKLIQKQKIRPFCSVVVVAAGSSTRAGRDKLFYRLKGIPILAYSLTVFQQSDSVDEIVLVTREDRIPETTQLCAEYNFTKVTKVIKGGASRANSALAGVSEVSSKADLIAIHDGARPFVTSELLSNLIHDALIFNSAAPAVPLRDTIKHVENDSILYTIRREMTMAVQTPQVFRADLIKGALTNAVLKEIPITDDCFAVESMGYTIHLTPGLEENIKITNPIDFRFADVILEMRNEK